MIEKKLELPFFSIEQPGGTFYYTRILAEDLKERLLIRHRSTNDSGIQRDLNKKRSSEISDYLDLADAVIPTPLVISVERENIEEKNKDIIILKSNESGILGEIIDGQHRYEGLKRNTTFSGYFIPICIFVELSLDDKASIFSTINSTQVKVPKSYIYDLFDYTEENTPIKFCHDVCKTLNYEKAGPLSRRIKMLGKKINDDEVLSQAAFVDAVLPLITKNEKNDRTTILGGNPLGTDQTIPLRELYLTKNITAFSKIISNYMSALRIVSDENWEKYILKSIGMKVFARVLSEIAPIGLKKGSLSVEFFLEQLSKIKTEIQACNTSNGTNKGVENKTFEDLKIALTTSP